jgi:hypothetical protein
MAKRMDRRSLALLLAAAGLVGGGVFVFSQTNPFEPEGSFLPRCVFREATGCLCPGCGSGRATHSLLHGRLALAWRCNPLFVIALPLMAAGLANEAVRTLRGRPLWRWRVPGKLLLAVAIVVVVFGVVRNLPYRVFDGLRPPDAVDRQEIDQQ